EAGQRTGGIAHDGLAGGDVARDHCAGTHERPLADRDAPEQDSAGTDRGPTPDAHRKQRPVLFCLKRAVLRRRLRELVVHEHHAVPDEYLVLDRDTVTDERVTLDLAIGPDDGAALYLDERSDPRVVTDPAAVEVRERVNDDVLAELDVIDVPVGRVVDRTVSHAGRTRRCRRRPSPPAPPSFPERSGGTTPRRRVAPRWGSCRCGSRGARTAPRDAAAPGSARRSGSHARAGTPRARRDGAPRPPRGARRARLPAAPPPHHCTPPPAGLPPT